VVFTFAIPRGQVMLAGGRAEPDAKQFEISAAIGSETYGIASNPFLDRAFRTVSFQMTVTINDDGTWSYHEEAMLEMPGLAEPYRHHDRNTLTRVGTPTPNPLARAAAAAGGGSLDVGDLRHEMGNLL
jgi:hypothetical protein